MVAPVNHRLNVALYNRTGTCAVSIVEGFYSYNPGSRVYAEVVTELKKVVAASKQAKFQQSVQRDVASTLLVTLNETQRKVWEEAVLEAGFVRVSSFLNHREQNTVHMYVFSATPQPNEADWGMKDDEEEEYNEDEEG